MNLKDLFARKPKQIVPFSRCPFAGEYEDDRCMGVECQLWSVNHPYHAAERLYGENGMCSLKLLAEAQAYRSRGEELAEMEKK